MVYDLHKDGKLVGTYNAEQIAKMLNVKQDRIYRHAYSGQMIKGYRISSCLRKNTVDMLKKEWDYVRVCILNGVRPAEGGELG